MTQIFQSFPLLFNNSQPRCENLLNKPIKEKPRVPKRYMSNNVPRFAFSVFVLPLTPNFGKPFSLKFAKPTKSYPGLLRFWKKETLEGIVRPKPFPRFLKNFLKKISSFFSCQKASRPRQFPKGFFA